MSDERQNPATQWVAITADGSLIGPTLTDRLGSKRALRGIYCTVAGDADLTDQQGNEESFTFLAGLVYALCPASVAAGATATLIALYGN